MAAPVVRFRIDFAENSFVRPGEIGLLEAIRDSGSLAQAARNIGMSYRHAWLLVESLKRSFREPITEIYAGGKGGRSMLVTEFGGALIKSYRDLEQGFATLGGFSPLFGPLMMGGALAGMFFGLPVSLHAGYFWGRTFALFVSVERDPRVELGAPPNLM